MEVYYPLSQGDAYFTNVRVDLKVGMEKYKGSIIFMVVDKLKDNMYKSWNCFAHYVKEMKFKMGHYDTTKVMDLASHCYSCRDWDLTRISCKHAICYHLINWP